MLRSGQVFLWGSNRYGQYLGRKLQRNSKELPLGLALGLAGGTSRRLGSLKASLARQTGNSTPMAIELPGPAAFVDCEERPKGIKRAYAIQYIDLCIETGFRTSTLLWCWKMGGYSAGDATAMAGGAENACQDCQAVRGLDEGRKSQARPLLAWSRKGCRTFHWAPSTLVPRLVMEGCLCGAGCSACRRSERTRLSCFKLQFCCFIVPFSRLWWAWEPGSWRPSLPQHPAAGGDRAGHVP